MTYAFFTEPHSRETQSRDGETYIERTYAPGRTRGRSRCVWILVVRGSELATFFRREDARVHVRTLKGAA